VHIEEEEEEGIIDSKPLLLNPDSYRNVHYQHIEGGEDQFRNLNDDKWPGWRLQLNEKEDVLVVNKRNFDEVEGIDVHLISEMLVSISQVKNKVDEKMAKLDSGLWVAAG